MKLQCNSNSFDALWIFVALVYNIIFTAQLKYKIEDFYIPRKNSVSSSRIREKQLRSKTIFVI
jgi:hypothetical protein